jgi:hypothetical protein
MGRHPSRAKSRDWGCVRRGGTLEHFGREGPSQSRSAISTPSRATSWRMFAVTSNRSHQSTARLRSSSCAATLAAGALRPGYRRRARTAARRRTRPRTDRDHRSATGVDRFDYFGVVDALQIDRGDAEVAVSELALDDDQWHALAGHLDRVCVTQLVRSEASANAGSRRGAPELSACPACRPRAAAGASVDDAEQRTGSMTRAVSHGSSSCHPQSSIPTSRRRPALPRRTSSEPRWRSRSASCSASASSIRRPARHKTATSPRSRRPCRRSPTICMTATISVTVGGRPDSAGPCCVEDDRHESRESSPATGDDRLRQEQVIRTRGSTPGYDRKRRLSPQPSRRARAAPSGDCRSGHGAKAPGGTAGRRRRCSVAWIRAISASLLLFHGCRSGMDVRSRAGRRSQLVRSESNVWILDTLAPVAIRWFRASDDVGVPPRARRGRPTCVVAVGGEDAIQHTGRWTLGRGRWSVDTALDGRGRSPGGTGDYRGSRARRT